jgi:gamma-glutamyltranspeptidase/glutathione hydrolase
MVVTPHRLASQTGLNILRQGGNAVQAAIAAAATLCVVYPHMTGLGGDGFWLILPASAQKKQEDGHSGVVFSEPIFIDACGRSALAASRKRYVDRGFTSVPKRGPYAALTVAGAVSGWQAALQIAAGWECGNRASLSMATLFADAVGYAEEGYPVSSSQSDMTAAMFSELADQHGFARHFLSRGKTPPANSRLRLPVLAETFRRLAEHGLEDFYRGCLAEELAADLCDAGSPLRLDDLLAHRAEILPPLTLRLTGTHLFNSPPPTQGIASLAILALVEMFCERTHCDLSDESIFIHVLVEATKRAFALRDTFVADPEHMVRPAHDLLTREELLHLAESISLHHAQPWPHAVPGGDTVWLGVMDREGNSVSYIQSIYHEFGSGVTLPRSGIVWQNRGLSFSFAPGSANSLAPGKKPFHTLNPAMALLDDGRILSYGTMGGEGQPQTQAAVFFRYVRLGFPLQHAVGAPRWLLGRAWGEASANLKVEDAFASVVIDKLNTMGHITERVPSPSGMMGHAGALVRHPDGIMEGAFDPRSDGAVCCW